MKKRLQVVLSDDAWDEVDKVTKQANDNFENGNITFSDVINEMILSSQVNLEKLQLKHTNIRKSLRLLASQKDLDVDAAIESLMALKKGRITKKKKAKENAENQACQEM